MGDMLARRPRASRPAAESPDGKVARELRAALHLASPAGTIAQLTQGAPGQNPNRDEQQPLSGSQSSGAGWNKAEPQRTPRPVLSTALGDRDGHCKPGARRRPARVNGAAVLARARNRRCLRNPIETRRGPAIGSADRSRKLAVARADNGDPELPTCQTRPASERHARENCGESKVHRVFRCASRREGRGWARVLRRAFTLAASGTRWS